MLNQRPAVDAGWPVLFAFGHEGPRVPELWPLRACSGSICPAWKMIYRSLSTIVGILLLSASICAGQEAVPIKVEGHRIIEHGGSWQGFESYIARYPDEKLTVVVL